MNTISFNMYQALAVATVMLVIGQHCVKRVDVFSRYCIPAPVIGGVIFAVVHFILRELGIVEFSMEMNLQAVFMRAFFCSVGFLASFAVLKKGGIGVLKLLFLAVSMIVIQDCIGGFGASIFGLDPKLGLSMGSISLVGGHGTAAAFGQYLENMQVDTALTVAIASATYGLIAGCMIGGPIAASKIKAYGLSSTTDVNPKSAEVPIDLDTGALDAEKMLEAAIWLVLAIGAGTLISDVIGKVLTMPEYIGALLAAAVFRNLADSSERELPMKEINSLGNLCLSFFLAMAMISLKLWQLIDLAVPMLAILLVQTVLMFFFASFVVFPFMGKDYDAAVMSSGFCGFGMGATPNAMANMQAITRLYGPSPVSFMIVPIVGALFIDFFNATIITLFANFF